MKLTSHRPLVALPRPQHATSFEQTVPAEAPASATAAAPAALKVAFMFALVSLTLLERFGVQVTASYSLNPALLALYGLVLVMVATRAAHLNGSGALMYVGVMAVAALSFIVNLSLDSRQYASLSSLGLLLLLYAPFTVALTPAVGTPAFWRWLMKWYIAFAVVLGVAGIVQFYAQFVFRAPWLFDFTPLIPAALRSSGTYNTTNAVGSLIKSNGFFMKEASGFSFYMAFALLCEWSTRRRKLPMAVMAFGIVVSYSGSGLLALGVALLFPLGQRTLVRVSACLVAGALVVMLFGESLNLSYTFGRIGEFESTSSSAYCRFIAPGKLVAEQIDSDPWTVLVGHGPGTTQKLSTVCETTYGKVLFEYGLFGAIAFTALIVAAVNRSAAPVRVRVALVVQWFLLGGFLLGPEAVLAIYVIAGIWPAGVCRDAFAPPAAAPPRRRGAFERVDPEWMKTS